MQSLGDFGVVSNGQAVILLRGQSGIVDSGKFSDGNDVLDRKVPIDSSFIKATNDLFQQGLT